MAKSSAAWLTGKKQFRSLTGVEVGTFHRIVGRLNPEWERRVVEPKNCAGRPWGVGGLEDHLLLLLILYRCAVTQDFLACLSGVDKSAICRALQRIEPLARHVIGVKTTIRVSAEEAEALIIDATKQPIRRPSRKQRCWYSGKKKWHVIKNEIIVTEKGKIVSASGSVPDRVHDYALRKCGPPVPKGARAYADCGFQGLQNDYPDTEIPYKKSKTHPLSRDEKTYNHVLSGFRVRVEHKIAQIKRFRILSDRFRYPKPTRAAKFAVVAGIVSLLSGF